MDVELLNLLCCPETKHLLKAASPELLKQFKTFQAQGVLKDRSGNPVINEMESGLICEQCALFFPVYANIPVLIMGQAISY